MLSRNLARSWERYVIFKMVMFSMGAFLKIPFKHQMHLVAKVKISLKNLENGWLQPANRVRCIEDGGRAYPYHHLAKHSSLLRQHVVPGGAAEKSPFVPPFARTGRRSSRKLYHDDTR